MAEEEGADNRTEDPTPRRRQKARDEGRIARSHEFGAAVMLLAVQGAWYFYKLFGAVEIALTLGIAWQAWRWPHVRDASAAG